MADLLGGAAVHGSRLAVVLAARPPVATMRAVLLLLGLILAAAALSWFAFSAAAEPTMLGPFRWGPPRVDGGDAMA